MDTSDSNQPQREPTVVESVPTAEPVGAGAGRSYGAGSAGGPNFDDVRSRLNNTTAGFESSSAAVAARGYLAPLEQFGRQPIAWAGAALVIVGLWTPVKTYSVSVVGFSVNVSGNMWEMNGLWSIALLLLAAVSAFVAWQHDYRPLWITGGAIAVIELVNLVFTFSGTSGASAHPTWGWVLLILGVLGILAAAVMRPNPNEPQGDAVGFVQNLINSNR
jgi:hypothetical protein